MSGGPRLSVIVPATDAPQTLARCEQALAGQLSGADELVIVREPPHSGPAAARNAGAARASGEVLVFVDADVVARPGTLELVRGRFAADPSLDALFGAYDDSPEAPGAVSQARNLLHHHVHSQAPGPAETFWAGLGAIRREAFERSGGFDAARYPRPSIEDIELGMRLRAAGARIELDPSLQGTHLKGWSLSGMLATDALRRGAPWVELLLERRTATATLNLGWRHRLSALATLLLTAGALRRRPGQAAAGAAGLVALNAGFYALLLRRLGPGGALAGMGVHAAHHLAGIASVPLGAARRLGRPGLESGPYSSVSAQPEK